jgi:hypothetical protein
MEQQDINAKQVREESKSRVKTGPKSTPLLLPIYPGVGVQWRKNGE